MNLTGLPERRLRRQRQRIGMIHQHFALLSSRMAAGNVAFPLEVMGSRAARGSSGSASCWTWSGWATALADAVNRVIG